MSEVSSKIISQPDLFFQNRSTAYNRVLNYLLFMGNKHTHVYVTQARIAKYAGVSRQWVNNIIAYLVSHRLISAQNRGVKKTCIYRVTPWFWRPEVRSKLDSIFSSLKVLGMGAIFALFSQLPKRAPNQPFQSQLTQYSISKFTYKALCLSQERVTKRDSHSTKIDRSFDYLMRKDPNLYPYNQNMLVPTGRTSFGPANQPYMQPSNTSARGSTNPPSPAGVNGMHPRTPFVIQKLETICFPEAINEITRMEQKAADPNSGYAKLAALWGADFMSAGLKAQAERTIERVNMESELPDIKRYGKD